MSLVEAVELLESRWDTLGGSSAGGLTWQGAVDQGAITERPLRAQHVTRHTEGRKGRRRAWGRRGFNTQSREKTT